MKIELSRTTYKNNNGELSDAIIYYNGSKQNMTFEENGNVHLIYSRPFTKEEALVTAEYIGKSILVN